jgi:hypothetical protein
MYANILKILCYLSHIASAISLVVFGSRDVAESPGCSHDDLLVLVDLVVACVLVVLMLQVFEFVQHGVFELVNLVGNLIELFHY